MSESLNTSSSESSDSKDTDSSESKPSKKKSTAVTSTLGGLTAERLLSSEKPQEPKADRESFWQKLTREADEPKQAAEPETKPEVSRTRQDDEEPADKPAAETEEHIPLDRLTPEESQEAVRRYTEDRLDHVMDEIKDVPLDSTQATEAAADLAFLQSVQDRLVDTPETSIDVVLDQAEADTEREINQDTAVELPDEAAPADQGEENPLPPNPERKDEAVFDTSGRQPEALPVNEPERNRIVSQELAEADDEDRDPSTAVPGSASETAESPDIPPLEGAEQQPEAETKDSEPSAIGAATAAIPPAGGGGGLPPEIVARWASGDDGEPPIPPDGPAAAGSLAYIPSPRPAPLIETATAGMASGGEALRAERQAAARGLMVGGIVGYLVGRRSGRIKTEKQLKPIQAKLERQVDRLEQSVASKEQSIRVMAAERAQAIQNPVERQRLTEQLVPAAVRQEAAVIPAARKSPEAKPIERQTRPMETTRAIKPAQEQSVDSRERPVLEPQTPIVHPERLGKFIVEAPLAAAALTSRQAESIAHTSPLEAGRRTEPTPLDVGRRMEATPLQSLQDKRVESFTPLQALQGRRVETFTPRELSQVAEKVSFEGVTLKELQDSRRLDERAVRRVVAEHLKGGNVREVLARELLEKELTFERDPKMRARAAQALAGGGSVQAVAAAILQGASQSPAVTEDEESAAAQAAGQQRRPIPDEATLRALKRQQELSVAGTILTIIIALVVLTLLLG